MSVHLTLEISEFKVTNNGRIKSTTTRHQMGAFEWNAGLVAGVALNARLTFKNVNLAGA